MKSADEVNSNVLIEKGINLLIPENFEVDSSLNYPNTKEIHDLISRYYFGNTQDVQQVIEFFVPYAEKFLSILEDRFSYSKLSGSKKRKSFSIAWEVFSAEFVVKPYLNEIDIEKDHSPEVLSYPMFALRRVSEILRIRNQNAFCVLISQSPLSVFTLKQLWHVNGQDVTSVREYYRSLAKGFVNLYSLDEVTVSDYLEYCCAITSPYKDMFSKILRHEINVVDSQITAPTIYEININRAGILHRLRDDQLEIGGNERRMVPPKVTHKSLEEISLNWLSIQSEEFFRGLPYRLLAHIGETNVLVFKKLAREFGVDFSNYIESNGHISEAIEFKMPIEFPENQIETLVFSQLKELSSKEKSFTNLLSQIKTEVDEKIYEAERDTLRLKRSIDAISERRIARPWESANLLKDLELIEKKYVFSFRKKKSYELKKQWLTNEVQQREEVCNLDEVKKEELKTNFENAKQILLDNIEEHLEKQQHIKITSTELVDPLFSAEIYSFTFSRMKYEKYREKRKDKLSNYDLSNQSLLEDYVSAWKEFSKHKNLKKLKRRYKNDVAHRVYVEYQNKVKNKSYDELRNENVFLCPLVNKIEHREGFEEYLSDLVKGFEKLVLELVSYVEQGLVYKSLTKYECSLIKSQAFEMLWQWFTKTFKNPYGTAIEASSFNLEFEKSISFWPWFEKQVLQQAKLDSSFIVSGFSMYRPVSSLSIEQLDELTWARSIEGYDYIDVLAREFVSLEKGNSNLKIIESYQLLFKELRSPYIELINSSSYDIDYLSQCLFNFDIAQEHLFSSVDRKILIKYWFSSRQPTFKGVSVHAGIFETLFLKRIGELDTEIYLNLISELNTLERKKLHNLHTEALKKTLDPGFKSNEFIQEYLNSIDHKLFFNELLRENLKSLE